MHLGACPSNGGIFGTNWFPLRHEQTFSSPGNYQTQLLPAAVVDDVPSDHLAQFVLALAREHLLSEIVASYKSGLGQSRVPTATLIGRFSSMRRA